MQDKISTCVLCRTLSPNARTVVAALHGFSCLCVPVPVLPVHHHSSCFGMRSTGHTLGSVTGNFTASSHSPRGTYDHGPRFAEREPESQRGGVICNQNRECRSSGANAEHSGSDAHALLNPCAVSPSLLLLRTLGLVRRKMDCPLGTSASASADHLHVEELSPDRSLT